MSYWRVWYTEDEHQDLPVRSDIILTANDYMTAVERAFHMFDGFRVLDVKREKKVQWLT